MSAPLVIILSVKQALSKNENQQQLFIYHISRNIGKIEAN